MLNLSGKKLLQTAFAVAILSLLPVAAHADQFEYVFTGTAAGYYNGAPVGDTAFTLTFDEDSASVVNAGSGFFRFNNVAGTFSADGMTVALPNVTLVVNSNAGVDSHGNPIGNVDFYDSAFTNGLGLFSTSLYGYQLDSNVSIPVSSLNLTPTVSNPPASLFAIAGGGNTLGFTSDCDLGFTATDLTPAPTPEPTSLMLLGSGLSGLAMLRRRFLKA